MNSSTEELREKLEKLLSEFSDLKNQYENATKSKEEDRCLDGMNKAILEMESAIRSCPLPREKEDLIEYMIYLKSHLSKSFISRNRAEDAIRKQLKIRYNEALAFIHRAFPNDKDFIEVIGNDADPNAKKEKKGFFSRLFSKLK